MGRRECNGLLFRRRITFRKESLASDWNSQRTRHCHRIFSFQRIPSPFQRKLLQTVSSSRLRVNFPWPGQATLHMPLFPALLLRSSSSYAANMLLLEEGRESPQGTLLTEEGAPVAAHSTHCPSSVTSEEPTYKGSS